MKFRRIYIITKYWSWYVVRMSVGIWICASVVDGNIIVWYLRDYPSEYSSSKN
jgi:hypothetical protein